MKTMHDDPCRLKSLLDTESIMNSLPVGVMFFNLQREIVYANGKIKDMLGIGELEHKGYAAFMKEADRHVLDDAFDDAIKKAVSCPDFEITLIAEDGGAIPVLTRVSPFRDEKGDAAGVICVVRESQRLKQVIE